MVDKEELIRKIRKRILKKNSGRSYYFLDLKFDEICEVIDEVFDSQSD